MKKFKVRIRLKTSPSSFETIINANSVGDLKKILEGQYGSNLASYTQQEIR